MKNLLLIPVLAFLMEGCSKENVPKSNPDCIENTLQTFKANSTSIALLKTNLDGQDLYWFQTEAPLADGTDDIIDGNCDLFCAVGGKREDAYHCFGIDMFQLAYDTLWHR